MRMQPIGIAAVKRWLRRFQPHGWMVYSSGRTVHRRYVKHFRTGSGRLVRVFGEYGEVTYAWVGQ